LLTLILLSFGSAMAKMSVTDFPEDLGFRIRVASALAGMTPSRYVRETMAKVTAELADVNPFIRQVFEHRP
jgi:hypothetical protein